MKLYIKLLSGEFLEITCDPNEQSIHNAIHAIHPEWETHPMRLFTMNSPTGKIDMATLEENTILCLFVDDPCYVRIFTNSEHVFFSISVSDHPNFTYAHTRTLFFEFTGSLFYDFSQRHEDVSLEAMIRRSKEFRSNQLDTIVHHAQKQWDTIMETYKEKRAEYLRRLQIVHSVEN